MIAALNLIPLALLALAAWAVWKKSRAGLIGVVVLAIANTEVASVKDFEAALAKADQSKPVNVLVRRDEWAQYLLIRPQK